MPITNMTPGHVDFQYGDRSVTIQGEALDSSVGGVDYVIYEFSIDRWNAPNEGQMLTPQEKQEVLDGVLRELRANGTVVDVERATPALSAQPLRPGSAPGGGECPVSGFWSTPSKLGSRRYFFRAEKLPNFENRFGVVMWHWDADQATPESAP